MKKILSVLMFIVVLFSGNSIFANAEEMKNTEESVLTNAIFRIKANDEVASKDNISYIITIQDIKTKEKHQFEITQKNDNNEYELYTPLGQGVYKIKKIKVSTKDFSVSLDESKGTAFQIGNISHTVVPINIKCSIAIPSFTDLLKNNALLLIITACAFIGLIVVKKKNKNEI